MSKSARLLLALALVLAVGAGYLLRELTTERARVVALQARVGEVEHAGRTTTCPLESQRTENKREGAQEVVPPAASITPSPLPTPAKKSPLACDLTGPDVAELARQLADPQVRATRLAEARLELEWRYPDLATALNLQPEEAARLLDLLAKQEMDERQHEMLGNDAGHLTDDAMRTRREQEAERRQQAEAERAALLGDAKLAEWNEYLKTLPARAEMRQLQTMLAETSWPLRNDQVTQMVAALADEQQRLAAERQKHYENSGNPTTPSYDETIRYYQERLKLIDQSLQRRRHFATQYLSTEQLKRYDEMLSLQRRRAQVDADAAVAVNQYAQRNAVGR